MEAESAPSMACPLQGAFRGLCQAGTGILHTVRRQVLKQVLPPGVSRLKHPVAEALPRAQSSTFHLVLECWPQLDPAPTPDFW